MCMCIGGGGGGVCVHQYYQCICNGFSGSVYL